MPVLTTERPYMKNYSKLNRQEWCHKYNKHWAKSIPMPQCQCMQTVINPNVILCTFKIIIDIINIHFTKCYSVWFVILFSLICDYLCKTLHVSIFHTNECKTLILLPIFICFITEMQLDHLGWFTHSWANLCNIEQLQVELWDFMKNSPKLAC